MQKIILVLISTIIMPVNSSGQNSESDSLADKVIAAFQSKNFEKFKKLMLDTADYEEFIKDLIESNHIPESERDKFRKRDKPSAEVVKMQYRKEFDRLISKGLKLGIDWTVVKKAKFVFKDNQPINSTIRSLSGHLNFIYKDTTYVIFGIEALKLSSGYKISDIRGILKGNVEQWVDPDSLEDDDL
jgi:hypothetical protein